jgi:hypothetical protein
MRNSISNINKIFQKHVPWLPKARDKVLITVIIYYWNQAVLPKRQKSQSVKF